MNAPAANRHLTATHLSVWVIFLLMTAAVLLTAGLVALRSAAPLTWHMGQHILIMNAVAPLLAIAFLLWRSEASGFLGSGAALAVATAIQISLLWLAHSPWWLATSLPSILLHQVTQAALFAAAFLFWLSVFSQRKTGKAGALFALLITGKLFCLLGALMVFAPRSLYASAIWEICAPGTQPSQILADQHLAGLLMITACPLSYVFAGVAITAKWLRELSAGERRQPA